MWCVRCSGVTKTFPIQKGILRKSAGVVKAVDDVSCEIMEGGTFGLVGESGSGKSTLGKLILGLMEPDSGEIKINIDRPQVIFQNPAASLDPKMTVSDIIAEGLVIKRGTAGQAAETAEIKDRVEKALDMVRLSKTSLKKYPHQFSGGERQRIAIARAVVTDPGFIVCDEPVSSLDVTVQLDILRLLKDIQKKLSATYLFISHDLRIIKFMSDRIAVMKEGRIVEEGFAQDIYSNPSHPYTRMLISSIPDIKAVIKLEP